MLERDTAKEQANRITATGRAVGFPANLKVYTGGKSPGVVKWVVYARRFQTESLLDDRWEYLESDVAVDAYLEEIG